MGADNLKGSSEIHGMAGVLVQRGEDTDTDHSHRASMVPHTKEARAGRGKRN